MDAIVTVGIAFGLAMDAFAPGTSKIHASEN
jgi:hypothetical protein